LGLWDGDRDAGAIERAINKETDKGIDIAIYVK
jgi:hypothetical protein